MDFYLKGQCSIQLLRLLCQVRLTYLLDEDRFTGIYRSFGLHRLDEDHFTGIYRSFGLHRLDEDRFAGIC